MIEFRQPALGPRMMRYGNMFRAADCPQTDSEPCIDLRHVIKERAVRADMVMGCHGQPKMLQNSFCAPRSQYRDRHAVVSTRMITR